MRWDDTCLPEVYVAARELTAEAIATWQEALGRFAPASREIRYVVDLGCGTGRFSGLLADLYGGVVVGIDPSVRMLGHRELHDRRVVRFLAGAAEAIPTGSGTIDLLFLSMVYHHLLSVREALDEMYRVLRPRGQVIVRNPTRETHEEGYEYLRFFPEVMDLERERMPSRRALTQAFRDHGFTGLRHEIIKQQVAVNSADLLRKVRLRGLSSLAMISDAAFQRGLCDLERYCQRADSRQPIFEPVDLFAFERRG